jgi:hypothetical protein
MLIDIIFVLVAKIIKLVAIRASEMIKVGKKILLLENIL